MGREARAARAAGKRTLPAPPATVALPKVLSADHALLLDALGEYIEGTLPALARLIRAPGFTEHLHVLRGRAIMLRGMIAAAAARPEATDPQRTIDETTPPATPPAQAS